MIRPESELLSSRGNKSMVIKTIAGISTCLSVVLIVCCLIIYFTGMPYSKQDVPGNSTPSESAYDSSGGNPDSTKPSFNIRFIYTTSMTEAQKQVFEEAKVRWERLIVKDFSTTVKAAKGLSICNQPPLEETLIIEDLVIFAGIFQIDGPGKILGMLWYAAMIEDAELTIHHHLGQAGPCGFDSAGRVRVGVMRFDEDDIGHHFPQTVRHELGHVLGIGSVWEDRKLISTGDNGPVQYLGKRGNEGHRIIGGKGESAVVETEGGPGTARSHWKDSEYPDEMMTGFLSQKSEQPISILTVLALADIGFTVDVTKADTFTVPSLSPTSEPTTNVQDSAASPTTTIVQDSSTSPTISLADQNTAVDSKPEQPSDDHPRQRRRRLRQVTNEKERLGVPIYDVLYDGPIHRFAASDSFVETRAK